MEIGTLTSRQNPLVRQAAALGGEAALRRETGAFLCEGARLCRDAVRSGLAVETCFFTPRARERYGPYLEEILSGSRAAYEITEPVARLLADTKSSQEIFCVCRLPQAAPPQTGPCLVLENLQDPGNLGTVLRTAEALGVFRVVLLGDCCDPWSPKALRASMGAVFRLNPTPWGNADELCQLLESQGYALHAAVLSETAQPLPELDFSRGLHAVFVGNEGNGLTPETIARCGHGVTIPMAGRAESLNASAAATILLWELTRKGGVPHG